MNSTQKITEHHTATKLLSDTVFGNITKQKRLKKSKLQLELTLQRTV